VDAYFGPELMVEQSERVPGSYTFVSLNSRLESNKEEEEEEYQVPGPMFLICTVTPSAVPPLDSSARGGGSLEIFP